MAVSKYVDYRVACGCVFLLLRFARVFQATKFFQQITTFLSVAVVRTVALCRVRAGEYLVGHGDVVELGSVADDPFCLGNAVVSAQPHHRLRQQPARLNFQ